MEYEVEMFLNLFHQLRNPLGYNIQETSERLEQLYNESGSIYPLFVISEESDDVIMKQYALYGVCGCLRSLQHPDRDCINFCRMKSIDLLSNEIEPNVRHAIIGIISTLLSNWKEWPELFEFIFQRTTDLESVLQILSHLVLSMEITKVVQRLEVFQSLILAGLESNSFNEVANAIDLLFTLAPPFTDRTPFEEYEQPLFDVFSEVAASGDSAKLTQILTPIIRGLEKGVNFLPFIEVFNLIVSLLLSHQLDVEYSLRLHWFLASFLAFHKMAVFEATDIQTLFDLEISLGLEFFQLDDIDPTMNWLYDLDQTLQELFYRIPLGSFGSFIENGIEKLQENEKEEAKAVELLLYENALLFAPDSFESKRMDLFFLVLECFHSNESVLRRMATRMLDTHAKTFIDEINENKSMIFAAIIVLLSNEDPAPGAKLFFSVVSQINESDEVFCDLMPIIAEMIQSQDPGIQCNGVYSLAKLIECSNNPQIDIIDTLYDEFISQLSMSREIKSPYSLFFDCISSICFRFPVKMVQKFDEFFPFVLNGLTSKDTHAKHDAINCIINLANSMMPKICNYFPQIFEVLLSLCDAHWNVDLTMKMQTGDSYSTEILFREYEAACAAIEAIGYVAKLSQDIDVIRMVARVMVSFIGSPLNCGIIASLKTFTLLSEAVSKMDNIEEEIVNCIHRMIQQCFKICERSSESEVLIEIFHSIDSVIRFCGIHTVNGYETIIIDTFLRFIKEKQNLHTGEFAYDPMFHNSCLYELALSASISLKGSDFFMEETGPLLLSLLNSSSSELLEFAIDLISKILQIVPGILPTEYLNSFLTNVMSLLINQNPHIASTSSKVILDFLCTECYQSIIISSFDFISQSIINRLDSELSNKYPNKVLLHILIETFTLLINSSESTITKESYGLLMKAIIASKENCSYQTYQCLILSDFKNDFPDLILCVLIDLLSQNWKTITSLGFDDVSVYNLVCNLEYIVSLYEKKKDIIYNMVSSDQKLETLRENLSKFQFVI